MAVKKKQYKCLEREKIQENIVFQIGRDRNVLKYRWGKAKKKITNDSVKRGIIYV